MSFGIAKELLAKSPPRRGRKPGKLVRGVHHFAQLKCIESSKMCKPLRNDESLSQKREYVRQNPVRRGLVSTPEDYRWLWLKP